MPASFREQKPPDVLLLGAAWPERALLRAQLIEEGHEVVAIDAWPIPRLYRRPGMKPRLLLIDLHGLPNPRETLDEVRLILRSERVLVVTALGTLTANDVRQRGFNVIERPARIGDIVAATSELLSDTPPQHSEDGSFLAPLLSHTPAPEPEAEMRKQDRIRQQQSQNPSEQPPEKPQSQASEHMKGSASGDQPDKPPRQPGKLPLPD